MAWFIFAILGAIFQSVYYASVKKLTEKFDVYVLGSGIFITSFFISITVSLFKGIPDFGSGFYYALFATGILHIIAQSLLYRALKSTELSLAIPLVGFTPIFLIFTSFFMLGEIPSIFGIFGIILIVFGSFVLKKKDSSFFSILKNKGTLLMLIVAFIYSISSNYDKLLMINSDSIFGTAIKSLFTGIAFLTISILKKQKPIKKIKKHWPYMYLGGIIFALSGLSINLALTMNIVPYVISLKRSNILFSIILGGLFFKEKDIAQKILGASIIILGVLMIILF
jgi:drug/metabolite transporter (DMT)-like permease